MRHAPIWLTSLVLFACDGNATSTPEALAETTFDLLKDGDFQAYFEATVITFEQFNELCPSAEEGFELDVDEFRDEFEDCQNEIDFGSSNIVEINPELESFPGSECGRAEPIQVAEEIEIIVSVPAGQAKRIRLRDAVETNDGWRVLDELRCSSEGTDVCVGTTDESCTTPGPDAPPTVPNLPGPDGGGSSGGTGGR